MSDGTIHEETVNCQRCGEKIPYSNLCRLVYKYKTEEAREIALCLPCYLQAFDMVERWVKEGEE